MKKKTTILFSALMTTTVLFSQIPTNGLKAWYKLDGNASDNSGNNLTATIHQALPTSDRFGLSGRAYNFDGIDDYIASTNSAFSLTSAISISCWFYLSNLPNDYMAIVSKWETTGYYLGIGPANKIRWNVGNGIDGNTVLSANQWYHVAVTFNGGVMEIYLNGTLEKSVNYTGTIPANSAWFEIGEQYDSPGSGNFGGKADEVLVYNRSLTSTEVVQIYNTVTAVNDLSDNNFVFNVKNDFRSQKIVVEAGELSENALISIFDMEGRKMWEVICSPSDYSSAEPVNYVIDISEFKSGIYLVGLVSNGRRVVRKIII